MWTEDSECISVTLLVNPTVEVASTEEREQTHKDNPQLGNEVLDQTKKLDGDYANVP
ncbi:hypothetical protein [Staphylococcus phage vB_SauH_DELF3]|nr:hypothetical protein [Staphylococcus phage vB_SauH_DELF3]